MLLQEQLLPGIAIAESDNQSIVTEALSLFQFQNLDKAVDAELRSQVISDLSNAADASADAKSFVDNVIEQAKASVGFGPVLAVLKLHVLANS